MSNVHGSHGHHGTAIDVERISTRPTGNFRLALVATAHCLLGCGLGEIVGMLIGMQLGLSNTGTLVLAVVLGFVFGLGMGMRPLMRAGFGFRKSIRTVVAAEALGIAVMEAVDVWVLLKIPGAMDSHFTEPLFWGGMAVALSAGYVAALPVNYLFIRAGIRHQH